MSATFLLTRMSRCGLGLQVLAKARPRGGEDVCHPTQRHDLGEAKHTDRVTLLPVLLSKMQF